VASVAADTSAIAPPLPLPSRSDAPPSAGPSGAFAGLLDASAAAAGPPVQPQGAAPASPLGSQPDDAASAAGIRAIAVKDAGKSKDTKDDTKPALDNSDVGAKATDGTIVAGLALTPLPPDPIPVAVVQSATMPIDARGAAALALAQLTDPATTPSPRDAAGLAAALAGMQTIAAGTSAAISAGTSLAADGTPVAVATMSATTATANADIVVRDPAPAVAPLPLPLDAAAPPIQLRAAAGDILGAAFIASVQLQTEPSPAPPQVVPTLAPAEASPQSAPPSAANASAQIFSTLPDTIAMAALNAAASASSPAAKIEAAEQSAIDAGARGDIDPASVALPAQVAAKFVASLRAFNETAADSADGWPASIPASPDDAWARSGNGEPGAAQPSFNPSGLTPIQPMPPTWAAPPHVPIRIDAVPLAGVPIAIAARVEGGEKTFEIRLDPPDLGRIEVRLNVDGNGRATSHLVVDRADTLDLLRRDAPALERALQSAGLTTDEGALQFSLRDQSFGGRDQSMPAPLPAPATVAESEIAPVDAAVRRYGPPAGLGGGIDIRV